MADISVQEVDVLKAYKNKLGDFKSGCVAVCALIDRQVREIKEDLLSLSRNAENSSRCAEDYADEVISRYDYALSKCSSAREYIGETDWECKSKLQEVEMLLEEIHSQLSSLTTEIENAGQHTKNFGLQILNMVDQCQSHLDRNITSIENYLTQS